MTFEVSSLIPLAVAAALALGVFLFTRRYGGSTALAVLSEANTILEKRLGELELLHRQDQQTIALLDARTSLEPMVAAVVEQFSRHEERAQRRHEQALAVWNMIAERLGPDAEKQRVV